MWKSISLSLLFGFGLSACIVTAPPSTKKIDDMKVQVPSPETDKVIKDIETRRILSGDGGQPGKISLAGVIVKEEQGQTQLGDQRFETAQTAGRNVDTNITPAIVGENLVSYSTKIAQANDLEKAKTEGHYLSLGCNSVNPEYAGKLTEGQMTKDKNGYSRVYAQTVVLCGRLDLLKDQPVLTIIADHLVLIDVDSETKGAMGGLLVYANKLTLVRKNRISTKGFDSSVVAIQAPWITLTVAGSVEGNGWLVLESHGGDIVPRNTN